jgi:hypothetical protein
MKRRGVGVFRLNNDSGRRGNEYAPRTSYRMAFGSIPEGMYVCHHCDNPQCVRPDHLFLGTQTDNMRDMAVKGRHVSPHRQMTHCSRGHPFDEKNTFWKDGKYRICRACRALRARLERRGQKLPRVRLNLSAGCA